ncbi:polyserase-2-like [Uranotaenia lowii]|uniref:polyserase-2-like n=1 Tax=Uranotaenia lowii TaxID=190385 RepID=UPI002479BD32|nr:polyserase-2-like [Uranotaenia lowii]
MILDRRFCLFLLLLVVASYAIPHLEDELPTNSGSVFFTKRIPKSYYQRSNLADCHARFHERRVDRYQTAVFGGVKANETEFPHMAVLGWSDEAGQVQWQCGGSLITKRFVLTAAHCVQNGGISPDVVRLGDVNLASTEDDQYGQQFMIKEITRHPQHVFKEKYYDLALVELEKDVTLTPGVCPACIWPDQVYPYESFEVAGFGATGFAEDNSPNLLKARIEPVDQNSCTTAFPASRGLPRGIVDDQLCAVGKNSDTCPGDSGGPLQTTLHTYHHKVATLVGITSFGSACGLGSFGVYQKIAPYVAWMESVVGEPLDPLSCVKNYESYLAQEQIGNEYEAVDTYYSRVYLHWRNEQDSPSCGGTLIDYNTVVTSAHCTFNSRGEQPSHVSIIGQKTQIIKIQRHPKFEFGSFYNDIALVRLGKFLRKTEIVVPTCLPYRSVFDSHVPQNKSASIRLPKSGISPKQQIYLGVKGDCNNEYIAKLPRYAEKLPRGLGKSLRCYEVDYELVPGIAEIDKGGPLLSGDESVIYGLNVYGEDGGSYNPLITIGLERYIPWIEQFVLERYNYPAHDSDSVEFQETALYEGSRCMTNDRRNGKCRFAAQCRWEIERYKYGLVRPMMCGYQDHKVVICCPRR